MEGKTRIGARSCINRRTANNRSRHLLSQFRKSGDLQSRVVKPTSGLEPKRGRQLCREIHRSVTAIFRESVPTLMEPNFRRSYGPQNPVKSALDTAVSENIYCGVTLESDGDGCLIKTGYGIGSGSSTIGNYPPDQKVHPVTPSMEKLMLLVQELRDVRDGPETNFNHVAIKVYWGKKATAYHRDIEWDSLRGIPKANNSQKPGTISLLFTVGAAKEFSMRRYRKKQHKCDANGLNDTTLSFKLKDGDIFILDPIDEAPKKPGDCFFPNDPRKRKEKMWEQLEQVFYWKHSARVVDPGSLSCTIMLREVCKTVKVDGTTNKVIFERQPPQEYQRKVELAKRDFDHPSWNSLVKWVRRERDHWVGCRVKKERSM